MLYIAPDTVNMKRAVKDFNPRRAGGLTRNPNATRGIYSPTGAWGDPTLATREKGRITVEALVDAILSEIREMQQIQSKRE
jgi:creatinine amidohydrolase